MQARVAASLGARRSRREARASGGRLTSAMGALAVMKICCRCFFWQYLELSLTTPASSSSELYALKLITLPRTRSRCEESV